MLPACGGRGVHEVEVTVAYACRHPPRYGMSHALARLGPAHRLPSRLVVNLLRACYRLLAVVAASDTATCWRVCRKLKLCDAVDPGSDR